MSKDRVGTAGVSLHEEALLWDQHGCLPLRPSEAAVDELSRYAESQVDFISINVGCDFNAWADTLAVLSAFRRGVGERTDRFALASVPEDVVEAKRSGRIAVAFDLEGAVALNGDLSMIGTYHALGVRTMLLVYNRRNAAGGGCHDEIDTGLSSFGRAVVGEMNRIGMVVDASHCSYRTTMELFESSRAPVIFSHSNPRALCAHPRNITDEQIRACAASGGVIGINGVGIFLGGGHPTVAAVVGAIDHVVNLVGPQHVGLGLDYVFDRDELDEYLSQNPGIFPPSEGYGAEGGLEFFDPLSLPELTQSLLEQGYGEDAVRGILGENFMRVAREVWSAGDAS